MLSADTDSTTPARLAGDDGAGVVGHLPLQAGARPPGASVRRSGTAWRCMFEPMRARLASSCSRNGMRAAAGLTICIGRHVHVVDVLGRRMMGNSPRWRTMRRVALELAARRSGLVGLGDAVRVLDVGGDERHLVAGPAPSLTLR